MRRDGDNDIGLVDSLVFKSDIQRSSFDPELILFNGDG